MIVENETIKIDNICHLLNELNSYTFMVIYVVRVFIPFMEIEFQTTSFLFWGSLYLLPPGTHMF